MRVVSPRSGDVLEHGSVCVLSAEEFAPHEAVTVSIADARSWSGRWWRQIERTRARNDGSVRVRWVVPKDLPVADAYVVRFSGAGVAAAGGAGAASGDTGRSSKSLQTGKSPSRETDVSNVKVTSPLKLTRVGRDVLEISWSPSALPTEASGRDGWRLAVDVLPVLREDEYHADVVGDLFLRAAAEGLTVHTRKKSVLYDVSKEEGARRKKYVRLPPDRTYAIALAGFTVGELEAVFSTSRADARMALVQLAALGGGYNAHNGGARRVSLGHAEFRRAPAEREPREQTSPSAPSPSGSPGYGGALLASPGASIPTVAYADVVADADAFPLDAAAASSPSTPRPGTSPIDTSAGLDGDASRGVSFAKKIEQSPRKSKGAWETSTRGVGPFGAERGVNVIVVRASDLSVAYDRTWDVSGGRRADAARAACESLRRAFTAGELRVGSSRRAKWGAHFVALTTAGAWAMSPGKDGDDFGVAAALDATLETLGASRAMRVAAKDAMRVPGQPAGVAVLAACGPGGAERRAWAEFGKTPKDRARVTLTLARGAGADGGDPDPDGGEDDEWFPALVRGGTGSGAALTTSDWRAPWSSWGREPWGGVKAWAAEETRVFRYLRLVRDAHARSAFLGAAFETGSADGKKNGEDASHLDDFAGPRDATSGSPGFAAVGPEPFDDGPPEDPARSRASRVKGAERVERGDGGDGSLGTAGTDAGTDESSKARSTTLGNRVEVYGVVKALVEYASSKFAAAKWPPSSRLREKYRTVTDEELALTRAAEALFVDIAAGGSAFAASELVNAGASEFLARRICSLLSPEGDLLGVEAGSQAASEVAAEARTLARALARVLMRNGAACLAEAARRDGAVEAVVRAFLASWRGTLGRSSVPEIEACVETFSDADLRVAEVEVFAEDRGANGASGSGSGPRAPLGTIRAIRAGFAFTRTPHLGAFGTSVRQGDGTVRGRVCFLDVPAPDPKRPNAASASLPAATRRFSRGQKKNAAKKAAKKAWPPPAVSAPAPRREAASSSSSLRPGDETDTDTDDAAHSAHASRLEEDEDIEPWGGSDAGSDEVMRLDEMELDDASALARASARRMREDPNAQGGRTSAVPMDTAADTDADTTADAHERDHDEDEDEDVSLDGAVAVFRGERGGWRAHEHVVRQAPRLAHLAQAAGAVAVVFLWPDRAPKYPPTQNLLPSPNFDTPLRVPAFCAPASAFAEMEHALARTRASESERASRVAWEARLRAEPLDGEGSAACVARRCGDALVRAMSRRPSARGDAGRASRRASRGAGRVHGLHWLKRAREDRERREAKEKNFASASSLARTFSSSTRDPPTAGSSSASIADRETASSSTAVGTANRGSTTSVGESEGGWSWGGAAKYLGIGSASAAAAVNPAPPVPDASASTAAEANFFASNDDDDDDDDDDEDDVDTHDTHCRYDASEALASRRWSCAMRVACALGDDGAPLLERAFFDDDARADIASRRSVRVLCLDGGGIRGLATIVMLARIMRAAGAWCVGECFDLIVGTSTGGVIALGAGLLRLTLDEVGDLYDAMASEVFKPDGYYDLLRRGPGHAAAKAFERVMSDMLGPEANQPLYAAAAHPRWYAAGARDEDEDRRVVDDDDDDDDDDASQKNRRPVPPRVCLVSSLVSRQPSTLVLLRSYHRGGGVGADASADGRRGAGDLPGEHRMGAVDALRATTAAPWYMEELALEKELSLGRLRAARADEEDDGGSSSVDVPDGVDDAFVVTEPVTHRASSRGVSEKTKRDDCDAHGALEDPGEARDEDSVFSDVFPTFSRRRRGASEAVTSARDASRVESSLRFIDGAIACNNPTSVGIFEARRLFGRARPLCVVSLGTGAAVPCETKTRAQDIGNVMGNLVNATCDVLQVDALARSLLPGERDRYFRFQPVDDVFGCELNDSSEATRRALREAARRYMDTDAVVHETRALAAALRE